MNNVFRLLLALTTIPFLSAATTTGTTELNPAMIEKANKMNSDLSGFYKDPNSLRSNLTNPLMSDESLSTADGTQFNANIGCKSSNTFMKVLVMPGNAGDATFNIEIDGDMDGNLDTLVTKTNVSGICSNGYIQCNAGTWNNCQHFEWNVFGGMKLEGTEVPLSSQGDVLKSCYCINNSCGSGLVVKNFDTITKDIGSGIANAFQKVNPYYTISDVQADGPLMRFYGQEPASCKEEFNGALTTYKDNPNALSTAAFSSSTSNKLYSKMTNSMAAGNKGVTNQKCQIIREMTMAEVKITDIIEYISGDGSVSYCGDDCIELTIGRYGDDYWSGNCSAFETLSKFNVKRPELIRKAVLVQAVYDDWLYVSSGGNKVYAGPFDWNGATIPVGKSCELKKSWNQTPNLDFTSSFKKAGMVEFKTKVLVAGNGEGYTKARIYVDLKEEKLFSVKIGAPGDKVIRYKFNLIDGSTEVVERDSQRGSTIEISSSNIDFQSLCDSNYEFANNGVQPWEPPHPYRGDTYDTTVHWNVIQTPNCSNGLTGVVEVRDQSDGNGLDYKYTLGGEFKFKATKGKCAITSENVINACQTFENNQDCKLKSESVDGVNTWLNFTATGLTPVAQTKVITGEVCAEVVTRDWFEKKRDYACTVGTQQWDFTNALQRQHTIISSTSNGGYTDQQFDSKTGQSTYSINTLSVPQIPEPPSCVSACKTRKLVTEIAVNNLGNTAKNRNDTTKYDYFYHECNGNACPLGEGEELVKSCQCMDEFAEAASVMQLLRLSGKDMICTSGVAQPVGQ